MIVVFAAHYSAGKCVIERGKLSVRGLQLQTVFLLTLQLDKQQDDQRTWNCNHKINGFPEKGNCIYNVFFCCRFQLPDKENRDESHNCQNRERDGDIQKKTAVFLLHSRNTPGYKIKTDHTYFNIS